jgi:hypothetical protein
VGDSSGDLDRDRDKATLKWFADVVGLVGGDGGRRPRLEFWASSGLQFVIGTERLLWKRLSLEIEE